MRTVRCSMANAGGSQNSNFCGLGMRSISAVNPAIKCASNEELEEDAGNNLISTDRRENVQIQAGKLNMIQSVSFQGIKLPEFETSY